MCVEIISTAFTAKISLGVSDLVGNNQNTFGQGNLAVVQLKGTGQKNSSLRAVEVTE